jgi:F-type H+-transporting ATPase subunit b
VLIDPFTVIAQIVNFAILAFALKMVLYDRVIRAMDTREELIAARLEEAQNRESEASTMADDFRRRSEEMEEQRQDYIDRARTEASHQHQLLLDQARTAVDEERQRWERALQSEQHEFHRELQQRATTEVLALSRRVLGDLADADLESAVVTSGLSHLGAEAESERALLAEGDPTAPLIVRTAFDLTEDHRRQVIAELGSAGLDQRRPVRFERDTRLLLGFELQGDGTAVSWHAKDYLDRIGAAFEEIFNESVRSDGQE